MTTTAAPADPPLPNPLFLLPLRQRLMFRAFWLGGQLGLGAPIVRLFMKQFEAVRPKVESSCFAGYRPGAHDVFACCFTKSGTNWALQIAHQIAHRGDGDFEHVHDVIPWPDTAFPLIKAKLSDPVDPRCPTGLRVIKTHNNFPDVPYHPDAKYIVVLRDPKEVLVSLYHFHHSLLRCLVEFTAPVEELLEMTLRAENGPYGSWSKHTASWWARRDRDNVLVLNFADMKRDLAGAVRQCARLMGVTLTEAEERAVITKSEFAYMKAHASRFMPPVPRLRAGVEPVLVRRGQSGDSGELLSPAQMAEIDRFFSAELLRRGCDLPYDEWFGGG